jgi:hypothetical protein
VKPWGLLEAVVKLEFNCVAEASEVSEAETEQANRRTGGQADRRKQFNWVAEASEVSEAEIGEWVCFRKKEWIFWIKWVDFG